MTNKKLDPHANPLERLVGRWTTEATHPAMPGVLVHGSTDVLWLEGQRFLLFRARTDQPDFPDSLSIIGPMDQDRVAEGGCASATPADGPLRMHYYDSRGVFRDYEASMDDAAWRWWRDASGFSQRFVGVLSHDGRTITGQSQLCRDGEHWADDLQITYRRQG